MTHPLLILHGQNTHGIHSPKFCCSSDPSLLTLFMGLWKIERGGAIRDLLWDREKGAGSERRINRAGRKRNRDMRRVRRKKKRVKGCPTKKILTTRMNEKTIPTISYIKWINIGSCMNSTMKMHKGHACGRNLMTSTNLASWMNVLNFVG